MMNSRLHCSWLMTGSIPQLHFVINPLTKHPFFGEGRGWDGNPIQPWGCTTKAVVSARLKPIQTQNLRQSGQASHVQGYLSPKKKTFWILKYPEISEISPLSTVNLRTSRLELDELGFRLPLRLLARDLARFVHRGRWDAAAAVGDLGVPWYPPLIWWNFASLWL